MDGAMKVPGPDHPIVIEEDRRRLRILYRGRIVAETSNGLVLREASYPPVIYVPREDADMQFFERSTHATHCPYKGDASYFTLTADGRRDQDAVWSYEEPFPAMAAIKDRFAFYPQYVQIEAAA
jgi:uncharacterized protein (DUF427 family)